MSRYSIILNPYAGKGLGRKLRERILQSIRSRTSDFELVETTRRGEATEIARSAASPIVVAVGGDGTVHEVANGLFGTEKVLGVVPTGSGNDFVKSIRIPSKLDDSISALLSGRTELIDFGMAEISRPAGRLDQPATAASYFANGLGIGFDAEVAIRTQQISLVSGTLVYALAVLQTLGRYAPPEFLVSVDQRLTRSKNLLIAIGNGKCAGGSFYLTPDAEVTDGILDVCIIEEVSILGILRLMPLVMKGKHGILKAVRFDRGQCITVRSSKPTAVHADGEILGESVSEIKVTAIPKAMRVVVGPSFALAK